MQEDWQEEMSLEELQDYDDMQRMIQDDIAERTRDMSLETGGQLWF